MWDKFKEVRRLERQALSNGQLFMVLIPFLCVFLLGNYFVNKLADAQTSFIANSILLVAIIMGINLVIYYLMNKRVKMDRQSKHIFFLYRLILSAFIVLIFIALPGIL